MSTFMHKISDIYHCAVLFRDNRLSEEGIDGRETPYLLAMYRHPGITQDMLAYEVRVNKSSAARHMAKLEESGFALRRADPSDKRILHCYPTEKALAVEEEIRQVHREWRDYLTEGMSEEECEMLEKLTDRIALRAEEYVKGADRN